MDKTKCRRFVPPKLRQNKLGGWVGLGNSWLVVYSSRDLMNGNPNLTRGQEEKADQTQCCQASGTGCGQFTPMVTSFASHALQVWLLPGTQHKVPTSCAYIKWAGYAIHGCSVGLLLSSACNAGAQAVKRKAWDIWFPGRGLQREAGGFTSDRPASRAACFGYCRWSLDERGEQDAWSCLTISMGYCGVWCGRQCSNCSHGIGWFWRRDISRSGGFILPDMKPCDDPLNE